MTYSDFISISQVEEHFQINVTSVESMFADVPSIPLSQYDAETLEDNVRLAIAINNEKARSEFIIAPLLLQAWRICRDYISLFSGVELKVAPEQGLSGRCDFLLSASTDRMFVKAPILTVVEAKNDNLQSGFGQCIAEMVAVVKFNAQQGRNIQVVHGCVTTGTEWRFLRIEQHNVVIDVTDYYISDSAKILGVLVHILQMPH